MWKSQSAHPETARDKETTYHGTTCPCQMLTSEKWNEQIMFTFQVVGMCSNNYHHILCYDTLILTSQLTIGMVAACSCLQNRIHNSTWTSELYRIKLGWTWPSISPLCNITSCLWMPKVTQHSGTILSANDLGLVLPDMFPSPTFSKSWHLVFRKKHSLLEENPLQPYSQKNQNPRVGCF